MSEPSSRHIIVVGAGIVGVCAALELRRRGHRVTLIDREGPASACSFGNAGLFAESSFLPQATPSMVKKVPGWLLRDNGPVAVRWRYLPRLMPWLLRFLASAYRDDFKQRGEALHQLTHQSTDRYVRLAGEAGVPELVVRSGFLSAFRGLSDLDADDRAMQPRRDLGYRIERLDAAQMRTLEPTLTDVGMVGGLHQCDHGYTPNPGRLTTALCDMFQREGGDLRIATVDGFDVSATGDVTAVRADGTVLACDGAVLAGGAWSTRLLRPLGVRIPLETERGYHVMIRNPGVCVTRPVYSGEGKMVMTPMEEGLRVAGTVEFASVDAEPNPARVKNLLAHAHHFLPGLNSDDHTIWMGCRPTLPDSLPVIDRLAAHPNLVLAFGHQHLGLTCAPATAPIVADLVGERVPNTAIAAFRADRFR